MATASKPKALARFKPREQPDVPERIGAKLRAFANNWRGNIEDTLTACASQGVKIFPFEARRYLQHPGFIEIIRESVKANPGIGVWDLHELQRFLTRVAAGYEADGYETVYVTVPVLPCEGDYNDAQGGAQWRKEAVRVETYVRMADRIKAADMLAKTLGGYIDRLEVSGDFKVTVTELLDDDLRNAIDITPKSPALTNADSEKASLPPVLQFTHCAQSIVSEIFD